MRVDEDGPTLSRGILRVGTLIVVIAVISYSFWNIYSESAASNRLSATAAIYDYTESCDAEGNLIATGQPNWIDLNHDVFEAFRKACTGKPAELLLVEEGKVARTEINRVKKC